MWLPSDFDIFYGRLRDPDVVAERLRHLLRPVDAGEQGNGEHHLRRLAVRLLDRPAHQQVEGLVRPAELDVGAHHHRVVALEHGVEQLQERDRLPRGPAPGEVVALEQLGGGDVPGQPEEVLHRHVQPLRVAPHLEPLVEGQHVAGLLLEGARIGVDLRAREDRPRGRPARGVADPGGVVADDQHDGVSGVLELPELREHDRVADVDVGCRRVDAELDAQRTPLRRGLLELLGQAAPRQAVDRVPGQVGRRPRGLGAGFVHAPQC
jgi:hypothetical protein